MTDLPSTRKAKRTQFTHLTISHCIKRTHHSDINVHFNPTKCRTWLLY